MGMNMKLPMSGIGFTWIIGIVANLLGDVLPLVTPSVKKGLEALLFELYQKAMETSNPWDDFLIRFIIRCVGLKSPSDV